MASAESSSEDEYELVGADEVKGVPLASGTVSKSVPGAPIPSNSLPTVVPASQQPQSQGLPQAQYNPHIQPQVMSSGVVGAAPHQAPRPPLPPQQKADLTPAKDGTKANVPAEDIEALMSLAVFATGEEKKGSHNVQNSQQQLQAPTTCKKFGSYGEFVRLIPCCSYR